MFPFIVEERSSITVSTVSEPTFKPTVIFDEVVTTTPTVQLRDQLLHPTQDLGQRQTFFATFDNSTRSVNLRCDALDPIGDVVIVNVWNMQDPVTSPGATVLFKEGPISSPRKIMTVPIGSGQVDAAARTAWVGTQGTSGRPEIVVVGGPGHHVAVRYSLLSSTVANTIVTSGGNGPSVVDLDMVDGPGFLQSPSDVWLLRVHNDGSRQVLTVQSATAEFDPILMLVTETGQMLGTRKAVSLVVNGPTLPQTFYIAVASGNGRAGHFTVSSTSHLAEPPPTTFTGQQLP
jgi:hypothetical protein